MRSAASCTSPTDSTRFLPTSSATTADRYITRSRIASAAARTMRTRSAPGVWRHVGAKSRATRTASATSSAEASANVPRRSECCAGFWTSNVASAARPTLTVDDELVLGDVRAGLLDRRVERGVRGLVAEGRRGVGDLGRHGLVMDAIAGRVDAPGAVEAGPEGDALGADRRCSAAGWTWAAGPPEGWLWVARADVFRSRRGLRRSLLAAMALTALAQLRPLLRTRNRCAPQRASALRSRSPALISMLRNLQS